MTSARTKVRTFSTRDSHSSAEALSISADAMVHLPARRSGWRLLAPLGKAKFQGPDMARKD